MKLPRIKLFKRTKEEGEKEASKGKKGKKKNKKEKHQAFLLEEFEKKRVLQIDNNKDNEEYLGKKK